MKKIIFLLFISIISFSLFAQKTTTHIVKKNETINSIAKNYGVTVKEILKASPNTAQNLKKGKGLIVGQQLNIPQKEKKGVNNKWDKRKKSTVKPDANKQEKVDSNGSTDNNKNKEESISNKVAELNHQNELQKEIILNQDMIINTGYIKIGTKKQLKEAGIISSNVFSSPKLSISDLTPDICQTIDIREMTEITLNSKSPKILTSMPSRSYALQKSTDGTSYILIIFDTTLFWSISNYLVIML